MAVAGAPSDEMGWGGSSSNLIVVIVIVKYIMLILIVMLILARTVQNVGVTNSGFLFCADGLDKGKARVYVFLFMGLGVPELEVLVRCNQVCCSTCT